MKLAKLSDVFPKKLGLAPGIMVQAVGAEAVVIDAKSEICWQLNSPGYALMTEIRDHGSVADGASKLAGLYDVDDETLFADMADLVRSLMDAGLVIEMT
jgi:hypothetical protein